MKALPSWYPTQPGARVNRRLNVAGWASGCSETARSPTGWCRSGLWGRGAKGGRSASRVPPWLAPPLPVVGYQPWQPY
jgi:hypothetical protein